MSVGSSRMWRTAILFGLSFTIFDLTAHAAQLAGQGRVCSNNPTAAAALARLDKKLGADRAALANCNAVGRHCPNESVFQKNIVDDNAEIDRESSLCGAAQSLPLGTPRRLPQAQIVSPQIFGPQTPVEGPQTLPVVTPPQRPAPRRRGSVPLVVTDISPDMPYGTGVSTGADTGGRVYTLAIDPTNDQVLYAVPDSGVWKSTDAGQSWHQASIGLRNGFSHALRTNEKLALDGNNAKRLVLITMVDDGRTNQQPYGGGVYVSTDGAAHWRHAEFQVGYTFGLCSDHSADTISVAFVSGQPFVATPCGFLTNADRGLADGKWTTLPNSPNAPASKGAYIAANSWGNALFVCAKGSNKIFWSTNLGQTWNAPVSLGTGHGCWSLTVVPVAGQPVPDTVAVIYPIPMPTKTSPPWDAALVNLSTGKITSLGFKAVAVGGSGVPAIFTARKASAQNYDSRPGIAYDIYAADEWNFFVYSAATTGWKRLQGSDGFALHMDTYSMAFPSSYDPDNGVCTAYAANDGGIFKNTSKQSAASGCDPSGGWVAAMYGLHALGAGSMAGVSQTAGLPGSILYVATADNDAWAMPLPQGGVQSGPLDYSLGDAGRVSVDPAYPRQVVGTRNLVAIVVVSPNGNAPGPSLPTDPSYPRGNTIVVSPFTTKAVPPFNAVPECGTVQAVPSGPGTCAGLFSGFASNQIQLTQLMALNGETVAAPAYFAVELFPNNQSDAIVSSSANPPTLQSWAPIETGQAQNFFGHGMIASVASSGGLANPLLWVVTKDGKIFKGALKKALRNKQWNSASSAWEVSQWLPAPDVGLGAAALLWVNPYNSQYAWVTDTQKQIIQKTIDGGESWNPDATLTSAATNNGEFRFSPCDGSMYGPCALSMMSFSRLHPNIAVTALWPGGVAYSHDLGQTWAVLDGVVSDPATNPPTPASEQNLRGFTLGVWYDDNTIQGAPSIYVSRPWNKILRVDGDFDSLPSQ